MSATANYLLSYRGDSDPMRVEQNNSSGGSERRHRQRLPLHWNVFIFREADSCPLSSRTKDLSSEGFYCLVEKPLTPGEEVYCDIIIPPQGPLIQAAGGSLHCRIRILRVETIAGGSYGLACRIEEYSVSRWKPQVVSPAVPAKLC